MPELIPKIKNVTTKESFFQSDSWFKLLRWLIIFFILIFFLLITLVWGIYRQKWQNYFIEAFTEIVPLPVATVDYYHPISIGEYSQNSRAIKTFLESQNASQSGGGFDFSTPEGIKKLEIVRKNIINQLIDNKIIELEARKRGIAFSNQDAFTIAEQIINRNNQRNENLMQLKLLYGWDEKTFAIETVKKMLYREKLTENLNNSGELKQIAQNRIREIQQKIQKGDNFENLAKEYSDASSRQYGGYLPPFTEDEAPAEFKNFVFQLSEGEISQPKETEVGWQIVKLEKKFSENGKNKVQIRAIFIKKDNFDDWLLNQKKEHSVQVFSGLYNWHAQMGKLYFKDENLNQLDDQINRDSLNEKTQELDFFLKQTKN